ncbi:hypothetical protein QYE76_065309 [Lolium multiflorum]|uniref:Uncharacterized protein n=1 Tax=Lolium multiflorum TaxID=4521 RepID=A0AAD8S8M4_LOLMU|nr:hypothetical protein QYE76_065309 [Lolium multiflorum]
MAPRRRSNTGFIGVACGLRDISAEITAGGTRVWLGTFYTKEAAAAHTTLRLGGLASGGLIPPEDEQFMARWRRQSWTVRGADALSEGQVDVQEREEGGKAAEEGRG